MVGQARDEYLFHMSADAGSPGEQRPVPAGQDLGALRPEDFLSEGLPTVMRGYDRGRVERLLLRASEGYGYVVRQRDALRERLRSLESDVAAAEGEARVSAASVAELTQRVAAAEAELERAREAGDQAGRKLDPSDSDEEAAGLLLAAVRAAEEIRVSSRDRALATLLRARARAAVATAALEREQRMLDEMQGRRLDAERVSAELLAQARAESERVATERREADRLTAALGDERARVRQFLSGALSALDPGGAAEGLPADPPIEARHDE